MARIAYINRKFQPASLRLIQHANTICAEYANQGYDLTLRQLYYQFVARGIIPNTVKSYKTLGSVINDARLAGMLDWDYITDRTRNIEKRGHWDHPRDIIEAVAEQFHVNYWEHQHMHVEVWVEKEALAGVVEQACHPLDVTSFSCRGYVSQSEQWASAQRFLKLIKQGKRIRVVHLGDHDPSGIDMSRDNEERIRDFLTMDLLRDTGLTRGALNFGTLFEAVCAKYDIPRENPYGSNDLFDLDRVALNMDQVEEYDPPPNPAKVTDARFAKYQEEYGDESWELDALPPDVLATLITDSVGAYMNEDAFEEAQRRETAYRANIAALLSEHGDVLDRVIDDIETVIDEEIYDDDSDD